MFWSSVALSSRQLPNRGCRLSSSVKPVLAAGLTLVVLAPEADLLGSLLFWVTAHTEVSVARLLHIFAVRPAVSQRPYSTCHTKAPEGLERYIGEDKWRRSHLLFIIQLIYSTPLHSSTLFPLSTLS